MKLNFWESFAISTGLSALNALLSNTTALSAQQKADIQGAIDSVEKVQADFSS